MKFSRSISCFRFRPATAPRIWHSHKYVNSSFYPVGADSVWAPGGRLIHIRTGWVGGLDSVGLIRPRRPAAAGQDFRRSDERLVRKGCFLQCRSRGVSNHEKEKE